MLSYFSLFDTQYTYQEEVGEMKGQLTVLWNSDTFIDRTNGIIPLYVQFMSCHISFFKGSLLYFLSLIFSFLQ